MLKTHLNCKHCHIAWCKSHTTRNLDIKMTFSAMVITFTFSIVYTFNAALLQKHWCQNFVHILEFLGIYFVFLKKDIVTDVTSRGIFIICKFKSSSIAYVCIHTTMKIFFSSDLETGSNQNGIMTK